jgi:CPSF A subunit region
MAFVCFQEDPPKLFLLGKDFLNYSPLSNTIPLALSHVSFGSVLTTSGSDTDATSAPASLSLFGVDMQQNLHLFSYLPSHPASMGGLRLLRSADYYLGANCDAAFSFVLGTSSTATCLVLKNGSWLFLATLPERTLKRLTRLSVKLKKALFEAAFELSLGTQTIAAPFVLSSKAYRTVQSTSALLGYTRPLRNFLDATAFLSAWSCLSPSQRDYLCKSELGFSADKLTSDLLLLAQSTLF